MTLMNNNQHCEQCSRVLNEAKELAAQIDFSLAIEVICDHPRHEVNLRSV